MHLFSFISFDSSILQREKVKEEQTESIVNTSNDVCKYTYQVDQWTKLHVRITQ